MKRLALITAVLCATITLFVAEAKAEKKIGVLIWSDETRYTDSKNGILEQLKKEGFGEPPVKYTVENAGGNKAKAAELAKKLSTAKMDMVIVVGTTAAIAVAKEVKDVPVIFSMVYDPVDSKIAADWKNSGNNTTGSSSRVPMLQIVNSMKQIAPIKRLAVLYTPGEKNSEVQLKEIQATLAGADIKVIPVPLTSKEEVASIMPDVVSAADALFLTGSSVVGGAVGTIVETATKAKKITASHLDDLVDKGVLLGVCANPHAVGVLAGKKAAKVLKGAKPATIPIESLDKLDIIINMKTAKAAQIQVPAAFMKTVTKTIE